MCSYILLKAKSSPVRVSSERFIMTEEDIAKEIPQKVKSKITTDRNFGIRHGLELLRLKDKPNHVRITILNSRDGNSFLGTSFGG